MNQKERILRYMQDFGSITPLEAYKDLGCMRLSSRIKDLENAGIKIKHDIEVSTNRYGKKVRYARYSLKEVF